MTIFLIVLIAALVFEYINGFHDAANAIATVVSTKVLTPRQAIALAATCNLIGALLGTAVATTIGKGLVDTGFVTMVTILGALNGAIIWNVLTWSGVDAKGAAAGLWPKVVLPMFTSPVIGFVGGGLLMLLLIVLLRR